MQLTESDPLAGINVLDRLKGRAILEAHLLRVLVKLLPGRFGDATTRDGVKVKAGGRLVGLKFAQPGAGMQGPVDFPAGDIAVYFNGGLFRMEDGVQPGVSCFGEEEGLVKCQFFYQVVSLSKDLASRGQGHFRESRPRKQHLLLNAMIGEVGQQVQVDLKFPRRMSRAYALPQ